MKTNEEIKRKKLEEMNLFLLRFRFHLDGLYAFGLNSIEKNIIQGIYPQINRIQDDLNKLPYSHETELPLEQEIKKTLQGSIKR